MVKQRGADGVIVNQLEQKHKEKLDNLELFVSTLLKLTKFPELSFFENIQLGIFSLRVSHNRRFFGLY